MSLLSNLLTYSSSFNSKEERSSSANSRFCCDEEEYSKKILPTDDKSKSASKSFSKGSQSSNSNVKIDPKIKCLLRFCQNFNRKVRKHYYSFFVTMATLKKKNVSLYKDIHPSMQKGLKNLAQIVPIIESKYFQKSQKTDTWKQILKHSHQSKAVSQIQKVFMTKHLLVHKNLFFKHLKELDLLDMKLDIVITCLENYLMRNNNEELEQAFEKIKQSQNFKRKEIKKKSTVPTSKNSSPVKYAEPLIDLIETNVSDEIQIHRQQKIHKNYKVITNCQQKAYQYFPSIENIPRMLKKQNQQQLSQIPEIGDLSDNSEIFRQRKSHSRLNTDTQKLEFSNLFGESFSKIGSMINNIQKNKANNGDSGISYYPFIPDDTSISTIKCSSNFGSEAVSFKNSLIQERESMKKDQSQTFSSSNVLSFKKKFIEQGFSSSNTSTQKETKKKKQFFFEKEKSSNVSNYLLRCDDDFSYDYSKNYHEAKSYYKYPTDQKQKKSLSFKHNDTEGHRLKFSQEFKVKKEIEQCLKSQRNEKILICKDPSKWKNRLVEQYNDIKPVRDGKRSSDEAVGKKYVSLTAKR